MLTTPRYSKMGRCRVLLAFIVTFCGINHNDLHPVYNLLNYLKTPDDCNEMEVAQVMALWVRLTPAGLYLPVVSLFFFSSVFSSFFCVLRTRTPTRR